MLPKEESIMSEWYAGHQRAGWLKATRAAPRRCADDV